MKNIKLLWSQEGDHKEVETALEITEFPSIVALRFDENKLAMAKFDKEFHHYKVKEFIKEI